MQQPDVATARPSRDLLEHLTNPQRGALSQRLRNIVRAGQAGTPTLAYRRALLDLQRDLANARRWSPDDGRTANLGELVAVLAGHGDEAIAYAAWIFADEAAPPEERERRKAAQSAEAVRAHMDNMPPTERQLDYLRRMGFSGVVDSRAFAASLIDVYTRGFRVVPRRAA